MRLLVDGIVSVVTINAGAAIFLTISNSDNTALIITAVTGLVTALFAGYIALKSLPQVHTLVNRNFSEQKLEIAELRKNIEELHLKALARAEAQTVSNATNTLPSTHPD